jgi:hypothetical protein
MQMTFGLVMSVQNKPAIFTDTLVTRPLPIDLSLPVNLHYPGFATPCESNGYSPVSLCQKVQPISPTEALVWSGSNIQAAYLCKLISAHHDKTKDEIISLVRDAIHNDINDISFQYIRFHDNKCLIISHEVQDASIGSWGEVSILGKGGPAFYGLLSYIESESPKVMGYEQNDASDKHDYYLKLRQIDAALQMESIAGFGSEMSSGAFIQTSYWNGRSFEHHSNVLYALFVVKHDKFAGPQLLLHKSFMNDTMIIRQMNFLDGTATIYSVPTVAGGQKFECQKISDTDLFIDLLISEVSFMVIVIDSGAARTITMKYNDFIELIVPGADPVGFAFQLELTKDFLRTHLGGKLRF